MKLLSSCCCITFILCLHTSILAEEINSFELINDKATTSYNSGKYNEALAEWKTLYASGNLDPDLLFNLGNAASQVGNSAEAILYYEKALRYSPADNVIKTAIQKQREKIENAVIAGNSFFLMTWIDNLLSLFRPGIWALIGLILILISLIQWLRSIGIQGSGKITLPGKLWIYPMVGAAIVMISLFGYLRLYRMNEGVVFTSCELKQGPSLQSPQVRMVSSGEKVRITDELTGWYKVNLLNMDDGWMQKDCLKKIDMREFK